MGGGAPWWADERRGGLRSAVVGGGCVGRRSIFVEEIGGDWWEIGGRWGEELFAETTLAGSGVHG